MKKNSSSSPDNLVTLSIVSHGNASEIEHLLDSLFLFEQAYRFQILITDNLGNDLPDNQMESSTILRNEKPKGFAANQNAAFQHARGKYFCILNPDIVFLHSVFDQLVARIDSGQADIVAPLVVDSQGLIQDSFRELPTPIELIRRRLGRQVHHVLLPEDIEAIRPDWMAGMFLLIKSETFDRLGGFEEGYYMYMEDAELCTRARLKGLSLLVDASAKVQHDAPRTSKQKLKYLFWHLQSAVRFFRSTTYRQARTLSKKSSLL